MSVYLDHAGSTPLSPAAREAMLPWLDGDNWANPSAIHGPGRRVRQAVEDARDLVAAKLGCRGRDVIFTSGATEANVLALRGHCATWDRPGRLLTSHLEHHSVMETVEQLEREGHAVDRVETVDGVITPEAVVAVCRDDTGLVTLMRANNEIGHLTDLAGIAAALAGKTVQVHTDATQAVGHVPVDFGGLGIDTLSCTGHKFGGPQGVGVLVARREARLAAIARGGQELGRRAGTENVAGIVGFATALAEAVDGLAEHTARWLVLRGMVEERLKSLPGVVFNSTAEERLPHIVSASFRGVKGEALLIGLDLEGVAVSSGSACHADDPEPSHVLRAIGRERELAGATVRFSFGTGTTPDEVESALVTLEGVLERLRSAAAR